MPFYGIASMLETAFSIDREHALSRQNWFINACAEQPKTVQKYSSNKALDALKQQLINLAGVLKAVYAARFLFCSSRIRNEVAMAIDSFHLLIMGKV